MWPDTFSNHFHTDVGVAVVETLEAAGFHVVMPRQRLCCGRPLYDYGFLELAERYLRQVLEGIRDDIRAGTPLVGIEPSCLATFKDELVKLLPHDDDARRLAGQSYHFAEFVTDRGIDVPRLERKAVLWGHCHYKATGGMGSEEKLLRQMGVEFDLAAGGCCGLAGSWGFEAGHHDLSLRIAEEGLLPAIRKADADTLIVADGFSCRTQVESSDTGRRALHVAQIMQMARERGPSGVPGPNPERAYRGRCPRPSLGVRVRRLAGMVAGAAALAVGAAAAVRRWRA